ncbi:ABC-2 transporter permease [Bacillus sp. FJAT-49711]|uniref:ABC-2 transporter permease n=1 Tax=Bacillus sp. FJAT-49711 TaxID=2833585 RepID=UPI001BC9A080|nr:ABC-2 transporter permease [Bacillus sp. FJAT-49711]MBS4220339.1 ABC-2 transporter permease [Bacillus sp. FJAT-49711]
MIQLVKADIKSIKIQDYFILVPFVFILAFLANPGFTSPFYMWIFYFTLGVFSIFVDRKRQEKVLPVMMSIPITRKEFVGAKYLLAIVWFFLSSIGAALIALIFDWKMDFFNFNEWITVFLFVLLFLAIFLPLGLLFKTASFYMTFILIFIITIRETFGAHSIQFHPIMLLSIILFCLSYLITVKIFERKNI